ncbi:MAG: glutamate synthase subunit beta [Chthonomonadales bacterium]
MADPKGFLKYNRETGSYRPIAERKRDWQEVHVHLSMDGLKTQAARCMDCGIPFCHSGCPLGNIIPDWNDLVYRGQWRDALERLHATNNFPEFTGRLCPAPCEAACVLGVNQPAVAIKEIEQHIIDYGFEQGWVAAERTTKRTNRSVAVVGSGPAGLATAQQLNRAGHTVTVFERDDRIGGLLRYGIPDFKMEKWVLDRRLELMAEEGVIFKTNVNVGVDITADELRAEYDAICLTGGSTIPRDLPIDGRELSGVHFAMDYLTQQNRLNAGDTLETDRISAEGKHVIILGGGDTGADCLGTAHRQGAKSVTQIELMPKPPNERNETMPWPNWPFILRTYAAHQEGGDRDWSVNTVSFTGENGNVKKLNGVKVEFGAPGPDGRRPMNTVEGSEFAMDCDLALLAMGFVHPQREGLLETLNVKIDGRGNVVADANYMTNIPGVFAAGDVRRGQSLIVWAIAEGREAARGIDEYLTHGSLLPLVGARLEAVAA